MRLAIPTRWLVNQRRRPGATPPFIGPRAAASSAWEVCPAVPTAGSAVAIDSATGEILGSAYDSNGVQQAVFFDYKHPGTVTQLANMPAAGTVLNGTMALNDNDWVVADDHYLWEPTGGGTVINLQDQLTAAGYPVTGMNARCAINNHGVIAMGANESRAPTPFSTTPFRAR